MTDRLIPTRMLFRFSAPCGYRSPLWSDAGAKLGEEFRLPNLAELDDRATFADVRAAWSEDGLVFRLQVEGKKQLPWCRETRPEESDGLRLFVDTRDTHNIHRASRFCHQFICMPLGAGRQFGDPSIEPFLINRARENPKPVRPGVLKVRAEKRVDGYVLEAFLPAAALTGFDPVENPKLGFTYAVVDRELGEQAFTCGNEFPYREDPSLWGTLELMR